MFSGSESQWIELENQAGIRTPDPAFREQISHVVDCLRGQDEALPFGRDSARHVGLVRRTAESVLVPVANAKRPNRGAPRLLSLVRDPRYQGELSEVDSLVRSLGETYRRCTGDSPTRENRGATGPFSRLLSTVACWADRPLSSTQIENWIRGVFTPSQATSRLPKPLRSFESQAIAKKRRDGVRYSGPAIVMQGATPVHLKCSIRSFLTHGGNEDWQGDFSDAQPRHVLSSNNLENLLRLPNGREGRVTINGIVQEANERGVFKGVGRSPIW